MAFCGESDNISFWKGVIDRKREWIYVSAHMGASDYYGREPASVDLGCRRFWGRRQADVWNGLESGGGRGFSLEEEHDLALMVREFVESGSDGAEFRRDIDSEWLDLSKCAKRIHSLRHSADQSEEDLLEAIYSLVLSVGEIDRQYVKALPCNSRCINLSLVKLLMLAGYDAGICVSKWPGSKNVPGGSHEYIDVVSSGKYERVIIDINFRSHFEIARSVPSYSAMLNTLPVIYVGTFSKLKQILKIMVQAAKSSMQQNSMPFPPWRSLAYLQSKWQSTYERIPNPEDHHSSSSCLNHHECAEHLRRLKRYCNSRLR